MKKLLLLGFFACFAAPMRAEEHPACDRATLRSVDRTLDFAIEQSLRLYESVKDTPDRMPRSWDAAADSLITCPIRWWASGFFPGTMWYLYEHSGREDLLRIAEQLTERMESEKDRTDNHDIGFAINCTYGNSYRLTHKEAYRDVILTAARNFTTRFDPTIGCTRSWNTRQWGYTVIIDNMMNLELLTVASHLAGDNAYCDMAKSHADVTMRNHFRPDASSYHVVGYDEQTGEAVHRVTRQGYSDSSSWARGQAWGLYGYTMMYRQTGERRYLDHAVRIGEYLMNHPNLPADKIPYWDYDAPDIPKAVRDASAGALMASACIELSTFVGGETGERFLRLAEQQLRSLCSPKYRSKAGQNGNFLITHSTGFFASNYEIDAPISYADYYFVEAMMRYKRLAAGRPVTDNTAPASACNDRTTWIASLDRVARPVLTALANAIDELVVVGYGYQRKSDVATSVTSVKADEMKLFPSSNMADMLRGRAAGVQVNTSSGRPGSIPTITIRGARSIAAENTPLYRAQHFERRINRDSYRLNFFADIKPFKGFNYRLNASIYQRFDEDKQAKDADYPGGGASARITDGRTKNWLIENIFTYRLPIRNERHKLTLTAVQSIDRNLKTSLGYATDKLPVDMGPDFIANGEFTGKPERSYNENNLVSFMARAQYALMDRYLLNVAVRVDGSSRFGTNNKWGTFPSVALAWRMNRERFLREADWIDNLKLRLSYGIVGNQNGIGNYETLGLADGHGYEFGDEYGRPASQPANNWFVGKSINVYYNYKADGIFQYDDFDIAKDAYGNIAYALKPTVDTDGDGIADKAMEYTNAVKPGMVKIRDLNGDGRINADDRTPISKDPDFTLSLSTTLRWKGFEFFMDWYGVHGGRLLNPFLHEANSGGSLQGKLNGAKVDYWTPYNPSNKFPRPSFNSNATYQSALAIQDTSYIRLRTLQIGYNFPKRWISKLGMGKLRIYATATNLLTFTELLSYSPELSPGAYPEPQTFVFGANLTF